MTAEDSKKDKPEKAEANEIEKKAAFTKKIIRIITVMAYVSGVSGAGVLLSLYYIIFWDPQIKGTRPRGYLRADPLTADAPLGEMMYENDPLQPMALTAAAAHIPAVVDTAPPKVGDRVPRDQHYSPDYQNNHSAENGMVLEAPRVLPLNEAEDEDASPSLLSSSHFAPMPSGSNYAEMAKIQVQDRVEEIDRLRDGGLDGRVYQDTIEQQQQKKSMRSFQSVEQVAPAA